MNTTSSDDLSAVVAKVAALLTWEDDWNSYDLPAPKERAVQCALHWIIDFYWKVAPLGWMMPSVTGGCEGEVIFEWRAGPRTLEVIIDEAGEYYTQDWGVGAPSLMTEGETYGTSRFRSMWLWLQSGLATHATQQAEGTIDDLSTARDQRHVCCAQCNEPLLRTLIPLALPDEVIFEDAGWPAVFGDPDTMVATEYRSAKAGPRSPTLTQCPTCGEALRVGTVSRIDDAQKKSEDPLCN